MGIDPEGIILCGFSSGCHLAASLGVHWYCEYLINDLHTVKGENRPDALVLGYPVISTGAISHSGSISNLLGDDPGLRLLDHLSLEKQVSEKTPPVFIWHTVEDRDVPIENSLVFIQSLRNKNVPFEFHLYTHGPHGLSLATDEVKEVEKGRYPDFHVATWHKLSVEWLNRLHKPKNA